MPHSATGSPDLRPHLHRETLLLQDPGCVDASAVICSNAACNALLAAGQQQLWIHATLMRKIHKVLHWTSLQASNTISVASPEPASLLPAWAATSICLLCSDGLRLAAVLGRAGLVEGVGAKPLPT